MALEASWLDLDASWLAGLTGSLAPSGGDGGSCGWRQLTSLPGEVQPIVPDLHPGDALGPEVAVDGGELAPDGPVVDDLPQGGSKLVTGRLSVYQHIIHGILALVALGRAAGAELENLECGK